MSRGAVACPGYWGLGLGVTCIFRVIRVGTAWLGCRGLGLGATGSVDRVGKALHGWDSRV
jgi:hypothetical protein